MNIFLVLLVLSCIIPFFILISGSFSSETALKTYGYTLFPKEFSLAAFKYLATLYKTIIRSYVMSMVITVIGTLANVCITFMFAYPLSRKYLPGRRFFSFFVFFTMLFNGGFVPTYLIYSNVFHIVDKFAAMIIPYLLMNAFYVIMVRTYIQSNVPDEVIEAGKIDGASEITILTKIVVPMSTPIIGTISLMTAIGYWNNWTNGVYFIRQNTQYFGIQNFLNSVMNNITVLQSHSSAVNMAQQFPSTGMRMALAVIAVIPVLIAYPFFQKSFVAGITVGSVKG